MYVNMKVFNNILQAALRKKTFSGRKEYRHNQTNSVLTPHSDLKISFLFAAATGEGITVPRRFLRVGVSEFG